MPDVCPCGPCQEVVTSDMWRCPECGKDLVDANIGKSSDPDRAPADRRGG